MKRRLRGASRLGTEGEQSCSYSKACLSLPRWYSQPPRGRTVATGIGNTTGTMTDGSITTTIPNGSITAITGTITDAKYVRITTMRLLPLIRFIRHMRRRRPGCI